jgi:pimeloyl-ACP methyl ester carboxylesterase
MSLFVQQLNANSSDRGTIVFLHGGGISGWSWRPVAELLTEYESLIVDLPGHGQSIGIGPFTMKLAANEVLKSINERTSGGAHVVGLSLGAQVTIQLLATNPEIIKSAFVSGCSVRSIPIVGNYYFLRALFSAYAPFRNIRWLVQMNARAMGVPEAYENDFAKDTRLMVPASLARIVAESQSFIIPKELVGVATRTFIAFGEKELDSVKKSATDLAQALPNSTAYKVIGRNHAWPLQYPQLCADAIRAFLSGGVIPEQFVRYDGNKQ